MRREILLRQIERRFGPLAKTHRERIAAAGLEELDAWLDSMPDAGSAAEALRAVPERINGAEA